MLYFYVMKCLLWKTCFRFYLSTFLSCLILVSIGVWLCEGRNTFLPFPWDPVTSRGSGSLRSSHGRGCTNTKHDRYTLDHVTKFGSRIYISKLPIMWWWTFLIIQSKQKNKFIFNFGWLFVCHEIVINCEMFQNNPKAVSYVMLIPVYGWPV